MASLEPIVVDANGELIFMRDTPLGELHDLSHRYEGTSILIFGRRSAEERKRRFLYP